MAAIVGNIQDGSGSWEESTLYIFHPVRKLRVAFFAWPETESSFCFLETLCGCRNEVASKTTIAAMNG